MGSTLGFISTGVGAATSAGCLEGKLEGGREGRDIEHMHGCWGRMKMKWILRKE